MRSVRRDLPVLGGPAALFCCGAILYILIRISVEQEQETRLPPPPAAPVARPETRPLPPPSRARAPPRGEAMRRSALRVILRLVGVLVVLLGAGPLRGRPGRPAAVAWRGRSCQAADVSRPSGLFAVPGLQFGIVPFRGRPVRAAGGAAVPEAAPNLGRPRPVRFPGDVRPLHRLGVGPADAPAVVFGADLRSRRPAHRADGAGRLGARGPALSDVGGGRVPRAPGRFAVADLRMAAIRASRRERPARQPPPAGAVPAVVPVGRGHDRRRRGRPAAADRVVPTGDAGSRPESRHEGRRSR